MSTQHTTLLIVGAGPTGLATALSLLQNGFRDFVIVDAATSSGQASRAITVHAATLEALDRIDMAESLVKSGIKSAHLRISDGGGPILDLDTSSLAPHTRYPYILMIRQSTTEMILETKLKGLGVEILRPECVVGLKSAPNGDFEVAFESGKIITARYVIGADGARSVIRRMAGISFTDPDGIPPDERLAQMVVADVTFSSDSKHLPKEGPLGVLINNRLSLVIPLPEAGTEPVYRVAFNVPLSDGPPPSHPPTSYLQKLLDEQSLGQLSSDPAVNPDPIHISNTIWSSRFRTHSAIADKFLIRMGPDSTKRSGGIIFLVGDAAHIHSPAGGQGMNLGLRDAIGLGPILAAHMASTPASLSENDRLLEEYAEARRRRALTTIQFTKRILAVLGTVGSLQILSDFGFILFKLLGRIPYVHRRIVWNLSGLGNR